MELPEFLQPYQADLEKYKLETVRIHATPLPKGKFLGITQSKFLGNPYLPVGMEHPEDSKGTPMILLAQINFSEVPTLPEYPSEGILQLFISPDEWLDVEMEEYIILYHEDLNQEYQKDFSFITQDFYLDSPILCEHSLSFEKVIEYGGYQDVRFQPTFNGNEYWDLVETLSPEEQEQWDDFFRADGHKIGGYAYFDQEDIRENNPDQKEDVLLLQIHYDEKISFGDAGVANVFINPRELRTRDFSKAYFTWDC